MATFAISWCIANSDVSVCLPGAIKSSQLEDSIKAVEVYKKVDKDTWIEIEKILNYTPKG